MFSLFLFLSIVNAAIIPVNETSDSSSSSSITNTVEATSESPSLTTYYSPCATDGFNGAGLSNLITLVRPTATAWEFNGFQYLNPYATDDSEVPASLQSYCGSVFNASLTQYLSTVPIKAAYTHPLTITTASYNEHLKTDTYQQCTNGYYSGDFKTYTELVQGTTFTYTYPTGIDYVPATAFSYSASSPCCGKCHITGGNVQVYFWPTSTAASSHAVHTLTNSEGFEFVSPSVYVAFKSLYASDLCGSVDPDNTATTIAFSENELSTTVGYFWDASKYAAYPPFFGTTQIFTPATWGTASCTDIVESFWQYGIFNAGQYRPDRYPDLSALSTALGAQFTMWSHMGWIYEYTVTQNPCSPTLSVPTQLYSENPVWVSCGNDLNGLYDPPYTLTPGGGLSAVFTSSSPTLAPATTSAVAGPSPVPATPTMTSTSTTAKPAIIDPSPGSSTHVHATQPGNSAPVVEPADSTNVLVPVASTDPTTSIPDPPDAPAIQDPDTTNILVPAPTNIADPAPTVVQDLSPTTVNNPSIPITTPVANDPSAPALPTITALVIGTQTLSAGGPPIIISSTTILLPSTGFSALINGTPQPLSLLVPTLTTLTTPTTIPPYMIGTQTLIAGGPAITVSGAEGGEAAIVSLDASGNVVIGSSTRGVGSYLQEGGGAEVTEGGSGGLGGIVVSIGGFGGVLPAQGSSTRGAASGTGGWGYNGTVFTGDGGARGLGKVGWWVWRVGVVVGVGMVVI